MNGRIAAAVLAAATVQLASGTNVIREFGGHDPIEFVIDIDLGTGDHLGVRILANTQPELPWKFEAYDGADPSQAPGYINYIRIADGVSVGDIHLSVVGDVNHSPPHYRGAAAVKALDLWTNSLPGHPNTVDTLDITADLGADGPIIADGAGTWTIDGDVLNDISVQGTFDGSLTVGGDVLYNIYVSNAITGPVTIMGDLCADQSHPRLACESLASLTVGGNVVGDIVVTGAISGPVTIGENLCTHHWGATLSCASLGSLTVGGDVVGDITVTGAITGPVAVTGHLCTHQPGATLACESLVSLTVGRDVVGDIEVADDITGAVTIDGDVLGDINVAGAISGPLTIEGSLLGNLDSGSLGSLTVDGDVVGDIMVTGAITGPVTIRGHLAGDLACDSLGDFNQLALWGSDLRPTISIRGPYHGHMMMHQMTVRRLYIKDELTGDVDLAVGTRVAEVDIGPIVAGAEFRLCSAGLTNPYPEGQFRVRGDVRGVLEIGFVGCPFEVGGVVYGDGLWISDWAVPAQKVSTIGGIGSGAYVNVVYLYGPGELRIAGGIPDDAIVDVWSIQLLGWLHVAGGVAERADVWVHTIGAWGSHNDGGTLQIGGPMAGCVRVEQLNRNLQLHSVAEGGAVDIAEFGGLAEDFEARLAVENGMAGCLSIGGDTAGPPPDTANVRYAELEFGTAAPQRLTGRIVFSGSITNGVDVAIHGDLHDPEDPQSQDPQMRGGHIIIEGGFGSEQGTPSTITIDGSLTGPRPFIAVDYDGWDSPHRWKRLGTVIITKPDPNDPNVPPLSLYGNTPTRHVWEITECRGDMNNDGEVNFGDINPFVTALSHVAQYSRDFPGLGAVEHPWDPEAGSRVYHGDCTCNGLFDFDDINPFIALVTRIPPCCSHECPCTGGNALGGGLPEPELLAAKLAVNVKPELFNDLVDMAAAAASVQTDPKLKLYWEKVHHALAP